MWIRRHCRNSQGGCRNSTKSEMQKQTNKQTVNFPFEWKCWYLWLAEKKRSRQEKLNQKTVGKIDFSSKCISLTPNARARMRAETHICWGEGHPPLLKFYPPKDLSSCISQSALHICIRLGLVQWQSDSFRAVFFNHKWLGNSLGVELKVLKLSHLRNTHFKVAKVKNHCMLIVVSL